MGGDGAARAEDGSSAKSSRSSSESSRSSSRSSAPILLRVFLFLPALFEGAPRASRADAQALAARDGRCPRNTLPAASETRSEPGAAVETPSVAAATN